MIEIWELNLQFKIFKSLKEMIILGRAQQRYAAMYTLGLKCIEHIFVCIEIC